MNELLIKIILCVLVLFGVLYFMIDFFRSEVEEHIKKEIGKHLQDNAHLFKQPSTSNAVYLIGKYYDKNGCVDMEKVSKEVFELGLDRLVNK